MWEIRDCYSGMEAVKRVVFGIKVPLVVEYVLLRLRVGNQDDHAHASFDAADEENVEGIGTDRENGARGHFALRTRLR